MTRGNRTLETQMQDTHMQKWLWQTRQDKQKGCDKRLCPTLEGWPDYSKALSMGDNKRMTDTEKQDTELGDGM